MREIKFRLWNPERKVLTGGNELNTLLLTTDGEFVKEFKKSGAVWMQYTGLKDKNGKEIYEGDILWTYEHGIGNLNREVIFDNGSFGVRHKHQLFTELRGWKKDYLEVIGNIHNNPELL